MALALALMASSVVVGVTVPAGAVADARPAPGTGTGKGWCTKYGAPGATAAFQFDNVWACTPSYTKGPTPFDENGTNSFQCVELSARYLWAIYGLWVRHPSNGDNLVAHVHQDYPNVPVGRPTPTSLPGQGDVISFAGGSVDPDVGHTSVIVTPTDPTTGKFTAMSQNFPEFAAGKQRWMVDLTGHHNGYVQLVGSGVWTHASWLILPQSPVTTITPTAGHPADPICTTHAADQGTTALVLEGSFYTAGDTLTIRSLQELLGNVTVPANGGWTFTFDVPSRPDGIYPVTVSDASGTLWTGTFNSGSYTCYFFKDLVWRWDAVGWDAYSPLSYSIDGVDKDDSSASQYGAMGTRHFSYDCRRGTTHEWQVTGTLGGGPGVASGSFVCP